MGQNKVEKIFFSLKLRSMCDTNFLRSIKFCFFYSLQPAVLKESLRLAAKV